MATASKDAARKVSRLKQWCFRLIALALGLSPLLVLESACHVCGWGKATDYDDPFVGFSDIHPLFVLNEETRRFEIPPSRLKWFCEESFAQNKGDNEYRIFVLGGSTVQGRPYEIHTSFTKWLELSLRAADPSKDWQVVNCGGISYASYRLIPILKEAIGHEADMIMVCTGHNEFLEDRSYDHIKTASPWLSWAQRKATSVRSYNLLRGGYLALTEGNGEKQPDHRSQLGPEVDAKLDWKNGLDQFQRDEDWRRALQQHFRFNLQRMIDLCQNANVPVFFVSPVSNLDWPPFKSEHKKGLSEVEIADFETIANAGYDLMQDDPEAALDQLQDALAIDDRYALLHYQIGKCHQLLRRWDLAKKSWQRAIEEDICPLRMLAPMRESMNQVAKDNGIAVVDAHALFASQEPHGIPGNLWLVDHVHPSIKGHKLLAKTIFDRLEEDGLLVPHKGWQTIRNRLFTEHVNQLDNSYFPRGQSRLRGLKIWAYGKVKRERAPKN